MRQPVAYPKVWALGHRALSSLLDGYIVVEEKCDGSQESFWVEDGHIHCRSHHQELDVSDPKACGMFSASVEKILLAHATAGLNPNYVYRGEYLRGPSHNAIKYARVPLNNIVLFDIQKQNEEEAYLFHEDLKVEAARLGFDAIPLLWIGEGKDLTREMLDKMCQTESYLGGSKVEGVVIKNYAQFGPDKKALMGKLVREEFKEANGCKIRQSKVSLVDELIGRYRTEARWRKAVQHCKEAGTLEFDPRDIPKLLTEVKRDLAEEEEQAIKDALYKAFQRERLGGACHVLPEWLKEQLAARQFEKKEQS